MHLVVKQNNDTINELRFNEGPVYIGRRSNSQVVLPDKSVSKQHAVIFVTDDSKWVSEDLDSVNKTYLNDEEIHKAELKTGDVLRITDFTIEISLEKSEPDNSETVRPGDTFSLHATLATPPHEIVVRKPDASHAPAMRLPAKRLSDFSQATETISEVTTLNELLGALMDIMSRQFSAFHVWCSLREQPIGPMTYQMGKRRDGRNVELSNLMLKDKIDQVVERGQSLVLPRVSAKLEEKERIRSAIIVAIMRHSGCYGVLYVDNAMLHDHYSLSDLDYLMMLSIHIASVLKKLLKS